MRHIYKLLQLDLDVSILLKKDGGNLKLSIAARQPGEEPARIDHLLSFAELELARFDPLPGQIDLGCSELFDNFGKDKP